MRPSSSSSANHLLQANLIFCPFEGMSTTTESRYQPAPLPLPSWPMISLETYNSEKNQRQWLVIISGTIWYCNSLDTTFLNLEFYLRPIEWIIWKVLCFIYLSNIHSFDSELISARPFPFVLDVMWLSELKSTGVSKFTEQLDEHIGISTCTSHISCLHIDVVWCRCNISENNVSHPLSRPLK